MGLTVKYPLSDNTPNTGTIYGGNNASLLDGATVLSGGGIVGSDGWSASVTKPTHWWFGPGLSFSYNDGATSNPLNLAPVNTPAFATDWKGCANEALDTSGAANYAWYSGVAPDLQQLGSTFTIIWQFTETGSPTVAGFGPNCYGGGIGWGMWLTEGLRLTWGQNADQLDGGALAANKSYTAVLSYSGGNATLYANGVVVAGPTAIAAPTNTATAFGIGNRTADNARPFLGLHHRVGVLKGTAWTQAEVLADYNAWHRAESDFTFAVVPDPQGEVQDYTATWEAEMQWLVDNKTIHNIQAVLGVGDQVNNALQAQFTESLVGWNNVKNASIPVMLAIGNHDYNDVTIRSITTWDANYPLSYLSGQSYYGGAYGTTLDNYYCTLTIGTHQYLIMVLELFPRTAVLTWAGGIISANPTYEVIVLTHGYLNYNGTRIATNDAYGPATYGLDNSGQQMWDSLIKLYPNILMVICGHQIDGATSAYSAAIGNYGNTVHQFFINHQQEANGGNGYLGLLKFRPAANLIEITTYSPTLAAFDATGAYTLTYAPQGTVTTPTYARWYGATPTVSKAVNGTTSSPSSDTWGAEAAGKYGYAANGFRWHSATADLPGNPGGWPQ